MDQRERHHIEKFIISAISLSYTEYGRNYIERQRDAMAEKRGRFITFEGIDGCGKSTQIRLLKQRIEKMALSCYETFEPSAGPVGSMLRQCLSGRMKADERTMAALFAADRLDHLLNDGDGILQKIEQGIHVICDRYVLSNYAYQGVRASLDWIEGLNSEAGNILRPDCHIFIDVEPEVSLDRMAKARFHQDLYETKERLTEVRNCYLSLIEKLKDTENIIIVDGNLEIDAIAEEIWHKVAVLFKEN